MTTPTAAQIIEWSDIDFAAVGTGKLGEEAALARVVAQAVAYIEWATGRTYATMPSNLEALAEAAAQRLTEIMAVQSTADVLETQADYATIQSFSAGSYNETRRSLAEVKKSGLIHADPQMHALLWALLTDEKRDEWQFWLDGTYAPAETVTEVDWGMQGAGSPFYAEPRSRNF